MSITLKGSISPSGKTLFRGGAIQPPAVDPLWPETVALINGDGDPWYANRIEGGAQVINPNNLTTGKFGNGFDISVSPISLTQSISIPTATDCTIEMWIYYRGDAIGGAYTCLMGSQLLNITPDRKLWAFTGTSVQSGPGVINLNDWTHIAVTVSTTGVVTIYAGGDRVGTGSYGNYTATPEVGSIIGSYVTKQLALMER